MPDLRTGSLPRAPVYIVDAHARRPVMEGLVAALLARSPAARLVVMAENFDEANAFPLLGWASRD